MRLTDGQRRILAAMHDGATLKVHRTVDGDKVYQLYLLDGPPIEVKSRDVESLKRHGFIKGNMKFPAAVYLLTEPDH